MKPNQKRISKTTARKTKRSPRQFERVVSVRELRKLLKYYKQLFDAHYSICKLLREKGESTKKYPVEEYQRGMVYADDGLTLIRKLETLIAESAH